MEAKVCARCVMDTTGDDRISFKADGTCNYCNYAIERMSEEYFPDEKGKRQLEEMVRLLKEEGAGKKYDCMMGLSGGLDSTYLAYLGAKKWGLRILAVHIDDGFDTPVAVQNIKNLCERCGIHLINESPDERQYMDLLKAFIRAGVPSIALPQDNVLQACLLKHAKANGIRYFLSGANFALESILQRGNGHVAADGVHIRDIHRKYGERPLTDLPIIDMFERFLGQRFIHRVVTFKPLDFIDYNRDRAIEDLEDNAGFNYYGGKHYESVFTRFVQVYYLPRKFKVDKRKSHLSSLIVSGQMTREDALSELEKPLYVEDTMEQDIDFILSKLDMERVEFDQLMKMPPRSHDSYKSHF